MANKIKPPNTINIPVGRRIACCVPISRIRLEYNEPIAHEMELTISKTTPTQLDPSDSKVGRTKMISPINPAVMPAMLNLVGFFLKNSSMNIATQIGIVELIRAAAPEDKYWAPIASIPCPPTMKNRADNDQLFQSCLFLN